jgi:translation initiation factor IF-3
VSRQEALRLADEAGLDLVEVSPNASPPVAKIIDWGKYRYEQQKQLQKQKAKQKTVEVKGIRLGVKIGENDLNTKLKMAIKFLEKEDKVKFQLRFKGREIVHKELGINLLNSVAEKLAEYSQIEQPATFSGREVSLVLSPKKK